MRPTRGCDGSWRRPKVWWKQAGRQPKTPWLQAIGQFINTATDDDARQVLEGHRDPTQIADRQLAAAVQHAAEVVSAPGLDVKHKLKVTIPILPALVAYEGEMELGGGLNLEEAWKALCKWVRRPELG